MFLGGVEWFFFGWVDFGVVMCGIGVNLFVLGFLEFLFEVI